MKTELLVVLASGLVAYGCSGGSSGSGGGTPDTTPPGSVTSFQAAVGSGQLVLTWTNPSDSDLATVMIRRSTAAPATTADGTLVFNAAGTTTTDTGVTNVVYFHTGAPGSHNGATGYVAEATASGFIYSEVILTPPLFFRIYASRENP